MSNYIINISGKYKRDYTFNNRALHVNRKENIDDIPDGAAVWLHNGDLNDREIAEKVDKLRIARRWTIYLFTNSPIRGLGRQGYQEFSYSWRDVEYGFPGPPLSPPEKGYLAALSILSTGYLIARGVMNPPIQISESQKTRVLEKTWWKPVFGNDYKGVDILHEFKQLQHNGKTDAKLLVEIEESIRDLQNQLETSINHSRLEHICSKLRLLDEL